LTFSKSSARPSAHGQFLKRSLDRTLNPRVVHAAGREHRDAKSRKATTRRRARPNADDSPTRLRQSPEEIVPRLVGRWPPASIEAVEFEKCLDRSIDPFNEVREEFAAMFESTSLAARKEPLFELRHTEFGIFVREFFDM
jgi:hypothetical protein